MRHLILSAALLAASPALAAEAPRTVDMTAVLRDMAGAPLKDTTQATKDDPTCAKCAALTLGHAASYALFASFPDETMLPGDQKFARYVLAMKIKDASAAELTAADVVVIKRCVGKLYGALVVGQAYPLLDPNAKAPDVN